MNLFHKADVHYLIDLSTKISLDDYRTLLANLFLVEKEEDGNII
jgi:hypothetical protein